MDLGEIESLLKMLKENEVSAFSYRGDDFQLKLSIGPKGVVQTVVAQPALAVAPAAVAAAPAPAAAAAPVAPADDSVVIDSPMVGTFYSAASPDADPYVKVGDRVQSGDVLCIVEAMKLMNEIEADVGGEIIEVLVENGQPVQFGQALFRIRA